MKSVAVLDDKLWFPLPSNAMEDGLLAIGGDITVDRLLLAYSNGIFPWYNDELPLWWHPDPRFILLPHELKVSKSMRVLLKRNSFQFSINKAFTEVMTCCKNIERENQDGSWINNSFIKTYSQLHQLGYAYSAEAWLNNELIGGLYGIKLGRVFFGESMFSKQTNASKYAFIKFVEYLKQQGIVMIDCQVYTEHLESLGAKMIDRNSFMKILQQNISAT